MSAIPTSYPAHPFTTSDGITPSSPIFEACIGLPGERELIAGADLEPTPPELFPDCLTPTAPGSCLVVYQVIDAHGARWGALSGTASQAMMRALEEVEDTYALAAAFSDAAQLAEDRGVTLQGLRVLQIVLRLDGGVTPPALLGLLGLEATDPQALPKATSVLARIRAEALPPTPAIDLAALMVAAVGAGRHHALAAALTVSDPLMVQALQIGVGQRLRRGSAAEELLGLLCLVGLIALLFLGIGCGDREGRPVRPLDCQDFGLSPDSCL